MKNEFAINVISKACAVMTDTIRTDNSKVIAKLQAELSETKEALSGGRLVVTKLYGENKKLRELLRERDGDTHDADCKINNPAIKRCNCGHDEVMALLGCEG